MYVYVRKFLNGMRVLVFCDRNSSAKRIISSLVILASPASQVNASYTMPAASLEVSIGSLLISIIKTTLKMG